MFKSLSFLRSRGDMWQAFPRGKETDNQKRIKKKIKKKKHILLYILYYIIILSIIPKNSQKIYQAISEKYANQKRGKIIRRKKKPTTITMTSSVGKDRPLLTVRKQWGLPLKTEERDNR